MNIRPAKSEEWKSIQHLNWQIFEYELKIEPSSNPEFPYTEEAVNYFKKAVEGRDGHVAFVCEDGGVVVGYAIGKLIPDQELTHRVGIKLAQLHTLAVDRNHRGGGIGKKLIAAVRKWAIENGANRLKIVAYAGNQVARGLYRAAGFHEFEVGYELDLS
jgi:ribosomal protein S18 acetylase RimI-like enzyme